MSELDWSSFANLPGDQTANFELLWRGAVRHSYGKYGRFQARAQQPGVEFHLKLEKDCALGDAGQWFGWQTKWWQGLQAGRTIGATRKTDVEDSLTKTEEHLPDLTNWILCTRRPLAPIDEPWWKDLSASFSLDHQVSDDLANLLIGDAELFRQTYFGDLVLTPDRLEEMNAQALADVRERWFPEVHQTSLGELDIRRMLAEPEAWQHLESVGSEIASLTAIVARATSASPLPPSLELELDAFLNDAEVTRQLLADAYEHLAPGGDRTWRELGEAAVPAAPPQSPDVLRKLRAANHPAALPLTNLVVHTREAAAIASDIFGQLAIHCVAVTGDAGFGKTHLAAKLTRPTALRPAGVLLYGRQLRSRDSLDDLAQRITVKGKKVETFEALLAATDAAAARAKCRLPIVIDGLNEAENPGDWKPLLERAQDLLARYPSVLLVVTLRSTFVSRAIPASLRSSVDLDGFGEDVVTAVARYFEHFKIDASAVDLPLERFNHPIELRIFCAVTNPARDRTIHLTGRAPSLQAMFDGYLAHSADRIESLTDFRTRGEEVLNALQALGIEMWTTNTREVPESRLKEIFGDTHRPWNDSILNGLQEEGILLRQTPKNPDDAGPLVVSVVYDLLAGHVIASAMTTSAGAAFAESLRAPAVAAKFVGDRDSLHPLAGDIFAALVFVLPQKGLGHLWEHAPSDLLDAALLRTTDLEADLISDETLRAWRVNLPRLSRLRGFWSRLRSVRAVPGHPFNAIFTDGMLRSLTVAERDLSWTEWLRKSADRYERRSPGADAHALDDLRVWTDKWRQNGDRAESDALRARWFMWMLTSTVRDLRDAATAALYWFGRGDPSSLFELAAGSLEINDPYVTDRAIGAAYGVATAHQQRDPGFGPVLAGYLEALVAATSGDVATAPTFHRLVRYYIAGTVRFAQIFYPAAVPLAVEMGIDFADATMPEPLREGDARRDEVDDTIHMDFGNYTLGRLFTDRANYDDEHDGHRAATEQVLGVVFNLGWRREGFSSIDQSLGRQDQDRNPGRIERYGKKYGWIGLYEVMGMLHAQGHRFYGLEVDIDPTFPQVTDSVPIGLPSWIDVDPSDDREWLSGGKVAIPDDLMSCASIRGVEGPWVLVHAHLEAKGERTHRGGFGLFNTVAVESDELDSLMDWWARKDYPGRDLIDLPSAYYLFAGEIPWHARMVTSGDDIAGTGARPLERRNDDGWRDPHDWEDPYIDYLRLEPPDVAEGGLEAIDKEATDIGDPHAAPEASDDGSSDPYTAALIAATRNDRPYAELEFERMAHSFSWEGHNSSENQAFAYVPSQRLSQHSGLTAVAAGFDQVDESGRPAALSFAAPDGFSGNLLYVREDVLLAYARGRALVTVGWGEREIRATWPERLPTRLREVYQQHQNVWRVHRIVTEGRRVDSGEPETA